MLDEELVNRRMLPRIPGGLGAAMADRIIRGESAHDVLEMFVDEITTTVGVGSGTDTALGSPPAHKVQKQQRKKALAQFKKYQGKLRKEGRYTTDQKAFGLFMAEVGMLRVSRKFKQKLRQEVREAGYKV
ncbi:hypothetical protein LCGC14_1252900 [marine sediment metagenome]|uniref:Uncharacterized protein n=1 Tax=marine sediment metagenome TaxID=412755 RepID=A0A0F9LP68_9ZZZZ